MPQQLSESAQRKVEQRLIDDLIPYANNARTHSKKQIRKIQTSLKRFGWMNPLLIDDQDNVICGHGRLEAARIMGETRVPVINVGALSEADRRAAAGGNAGFATGCALAVWFFGPVGCLIGGIIGAIIGTIAGGAAAGLASKAIAEFVLQAIFDADRGEVEDANVGDKKLGIIKPGNRVAVLGHQVYDGFHDGWHEIHPLMAVQKIVGDDEPDGDRYVTWDPNFSGPDAPAGLTPDDIRQGMHSARFAAHAKSLHTRWCSALQEAFRPETRGEQKSGLHRWTIHPDVDGCRPVR